MRFLDRFDLLGCERGERGFGTTETAVHQFVGAEHDGELGAASHQPQFPVGAGDACGIDFYPWNHGELLAHEHNLLSSRRKPGPITTGIGFAMAGAPAWATTNIGGYGSPRSRGRLVVNPRPTHPPRSGSRHPRPRSN